MVYNGAYTSMPVHIAEDMGIYKRYGLDPTLITVASGPAGVEALLGGSLDFVEVPTDQIMENYLKGSHLKIVVGNEVKNFYVLMARKGGAKPGSTTSYKAAMNSLKGARIGVNALGSTTQIMTKVLLQDSGMSATDVTYVADGSAATELSAWTAGAVDAQMAFTPFPEIVEAAGTGVPLVNMSAGQGPTLLQELGGAFEDWSASSSYIKANPGIVQSFVDAQVAAINWMKNPANQKALTAEVEKYVNLSVVPQSERTAATNLMISHYSSYLGYTVDRGAAITAWNTYAKLAGETTATVPASAIIDSIAPQPK
jgi:NitT/TauT family transport system substrate-binding protein